ncbi:MAG: MBL fold metallo-hydrolase [Candidatus Adiutricales bacterium]
MERVSENVYAVTGYRGCNPGFVKTSEGVVMIDTPQMPSDALKYKAEIEKHGQVSYLINTEPHGDHYTSNCFFNATIVAQQGTRDVIAQAQIEPLKERIKIMDPDFVPNLDSLSISVPSITFRDSMKIYSGEHEFELLHLPGHTPSETAVFIPQERVVFTGDNIFYKTQAFFHEAVPNDWLKSLETLKTLDAEKVVPGHGELCTLDYLDEQAAFIRDWIQAAKEAVEKGWSLEEAQERISFLDRYPMGAEMEEFGRELQKMNVARLYAMAKENEI